MRYQLLISLALLWAARPLNATHAQHLRTVALKGQQAPGRPVGETFRNFHGLALGESGFATFRAPLEEPFPHSYSRPGIWTENESGLGYVISEGDLLPGFSEGETAEQIRSYAFNNAGQVALGILYSDADWPIPTPQHGGIWSNVSGTLAPTVLGGQQIPHSTDDLRLVGLDLTHAGLDPQPLVLNSSGAIAFRGYVSTNGTTTAGSDYGIWTIEDGVFRTVMREGDHAPGVEPGVHFGEFRAPFTMNDHGQVAFGARLIDGETATVDSWAIYSEGSGSLQAVARTGDPVPGMPTGTKFFALAADTRSSPVINNAGHVAFWTTVEHQDGSRQAGIWTNSTGTLEAVALQNEYAPGTQGAVFSDFSSRTWLALNSADQIAFATRLLSGVGDTDATNDYAVWVGGDDGLTLVAREGQRPPGIPEGNTFGNPQAFNIPAFDAPVINALGQVAFRASFIQPDGHYYDLGIWAQDQYGDLRLVVRTGDLLEVAAGDFREVQTVYFSGGSEGSAGNEDSRNSVFNDRGELLFAATFTDGSEGLFVSSLVADYTLTADFDHDGDVDGDDLLTWQTAYGSGAAGDTNGDGITNGRDFLRWQHEYTGSIVANSQASSVPEPQSMLLWGILASLLFFARGD